MMRFNLKKPCNNCPFLKSRGKGGLGAARAAEIAESILQKDQMFPCHKTVNHEKRDMTTESACYGSLHLIHHTHGLMGNFSYRLAYMVSATALTELPEHEDLFLDAEAFINHHER